MKITTKVVGKLSKFLSKGRRKSINFESMFKFRPDDVVIVSYPKSGSTWLRFMLAHLISDILLGEPKEIDFFRAQLIVPEISEQAQREGVDFNALPSPRIMRSHSLYNPGFPKVIYLLRDGRDVLISYYYHFKKFHSFNGTLYDFILSNVRGIEWDKHVNSWLFDNHSLSNIFVIRYEDMLRDPVEELKRLLDFIDISGPSEKIREAVNNSDFDIMRKMEENKGLGYVEQGDRKIKFVRKGQKGNWKEDFRDKEKAAVKKIYGETLIKVKYEDSNQW